MLVSLLLPLVVAGSVPADSAPVALAPAATSAAAVFGDPPVRIDLNERVYRPGDRARVRVRTEEDGHLLVFQVDVHGNLRVLFPLDPFDDSFVRGDRRIEIDGRGDRETFLIEASEGQGWVYAAYSRLPFQVERFAVGDHWDYNRLGPNRLPQSPEPELTELVRTMARASFDYDIVPYTVAGRQVATTVVRRYDYYDCFGCGYYAHDRYGSNITIRIGAPARYYGSCWDAYWCDPYYYDPFYYRPRYVYYGPRYYRPYYRPPIIYRARYAARNRPYYPGFGAGVPYRDRRADGGTGIRLVSDNTVYGPAPRRATSGFAETPARREIEESPGYDLNPPARRDLPDAPGRAESPGTPSAPEGRSPERSSGSATPARRSAGEAERPSSVEPRATPERRTVEPRSAEPRSAEPSREPRSAEPRSAEPRSAEPRSSEPRRREGGPRESFAEPTSEIEARPVRPREERPAAPSRSRTEERRAAPARSADREPEARPREVPSSRAAPSPSRAPSSSARPAAPERRSAQPQARSGGNDRGSEAAPSRGGGRRRGN